MKPHWMDTDIARWAGFRRWRTRPVGSNGPWLNGWAWRVEFLGCFVQYTTYGFQVGRLATWSQE